MPVANIPTATPPWARGLDSAPRPAHKSMEMPRATPGTHCSHRPAAPHTLPLPVAPAPLNPSLPLPADRKTRAAATAAGRPRPPTLPRRSAPARSAASDTSDKIPPTQKKSVHPPACAPHAHPDATSTLEPAGSPVQSSFPIRTQEAAAFSREPVKLSTAPNGGILDKRLSEYDFPLQFSHIDRKSVV